MPLVLDGTNGVSGVDGTASNPAIEGTDSNTGIFYPAADTVAIGTGGTEALRVNSSQNVGIGTSSPSFRLDLLVTDTTAYSTSAYSYGPVRITNQGAGGVSGILFQAVSTGTANTAQATISSIAESASSKNTALTFGTRRDSDGTLPERMRIDSSGNVGIGTSSPQSRLHVSDAVAGGQLLVTTNETNSTSKIGSLATMHYTNSEEPVLAISVEGGASENIVQIGGGPGEFNAATVIKFSTAANTTTTGGTERARITSGGTFCIGRTSAYSGNVERLSVEATGNSPAIIAINAAGTNDYNYVNWNNATSGNNKFIGFFTEASATERGSIDYNRTGGLTRYNTTSDATLKNIIGDSDGQKSVEILNTTRIREYAWKDDEQQKPQIGVIAQELYETFKGAVSVGGEVEKTDEEGNVTTEYKPWGVDKTAFTFHLIAGWQAHEKMIQELKAEIAALKGNA